MGPIDGQTLGLIGLGNIARATARKAKVFGLGVIAHDPYVEPWIAREYRVELVPSMEELARRSDYVSVHVPLNPETRGLVGDGFFRAMKPTAFIINTCRGGTVDEQALVAALRNGELAGAGLDVFETEPAPKDNPLLAMDNVIATPHSAGTSIESRRRAPVQIGQEAARMLRGSWPMSLANPQVRPGSRRDRLRREDSRRRSATAQSGSACRRSCGTPSPREPGRSPREGRSDG